MTANAVHTIRLDFGRVTVCGRSEERAILDTALHAACDAHQRRAVWIHGPSGSGKSALVKEFLKHQTERLIGRGKFEEGRTEIEPYAGLEDALCAVVSQAVERPRDSTKALPSEQEVNALCASFPRLAKVLCQWTSTELPEENEELSNSFQQTNFTRLRMAFRSLLRALSTQYAIVLWLDDLQWAGKGARMLVQTLLEDGTEGYSLLLIASHRTVPKDHPLTEFVSTLPEHQKAKTIHMQPLSKLAVSHWLAQLLHRELSELEQLAETIHHKTGGNALAVQQFLLLLERQEMLYYSAASLRWEWDHERVLHETALSNNVLGMVTAKMHKVDYRLKICLIKAAVLGVSHVDTRVLFHLVTPVPSPEEEKSDMVPPFPTMEDLLETLEQAVDQGYLEHVGGGHYKFAHDRIREAALELLPVDFDKGAMYLSVSRMLRQLLLQHPMDERLLLQTAGLLHEAMAGLKTEERIDAAKLNYAASQVAMRRSSYFAAADFLADACELLGEQAWTIHGDLMAQVTASRARAEYCCGHSETGLAVANEMLAKCSTRAFDDAKKSVYQTKILCLRNKDVGQACEVIRHVLKELGAPLPDKGLCRIVRKEKKMVKQRLQKLTDEDLLGLPRPKRNRRTDAILSFFERMVEASYHSGDQNLFVLTIIRIIVMTLDHGLNSFSAASFALWGVVLSHAGETDQAYRFGRLGVQLAEKRLAVHRHNDFRAVTIFHWQISPWRQSFQEGIEPLSKVLHLMWRDGVVEQVLTDTIGYLWMYWAAGYKLQPLAMDIEQYATLLSDYGFHSLIDTYKSFFQLVSKLVTPTDEDFLNGKYMGKKCMLRWIKTENKVAMRTAYSYGLMLSYIMGKMDVAIEMSKKMGEPMLADGTEAMVFYRYLFYALTAFGRYKKSRRTRFWRQGTSVIRLFKGWIQEGAVNCHPMLLLLEAEKLACSRADAEKAFGAAITTSGKLGILHLAALANERAGVHFLDRSESAWAETYLTRARELYTEWGAMAKVQQMEKSYEGILSVSSLTSSRSSGAIHARSRLGDIKTEQYKTLNF